jgi:hypothetical protein
MAPLRLASREAWHKETRRCNTGNERQSSFFSKAILVFQQGWSGPLWAPQSTIDASNAVSALGFERLFGEDLVHVA